MSQLLGRLDGLKKKELHQLEKLTQRTVATDQFVSPALAEELCTLSLEMKRPLTLLLDRRGRVYQMFVGDMILMGESQTVKFPRKANGLCEIRALTTQLESMSEPSRMALTTLLQYRLDCLLTLCAFENPEWSLEFGEHPKACDAVFLSGLTQDEDGQVDVQTDPPKTLYQIERQSLDDFLALEDSMFNVYAGKNVKTDAAERAFLIGIAQPGVQGRCRAEDLLDELSLLSQTAGAQVVGRTIQSRQQPDPQYYIGKGKAYELAFDVQQKTADLIIVDDELSSVQQRSLEQILRTRVVDRTEVILDIFAQRAQSWEGKIQVELAQLQYLLPRLTSHGKTFSQQTAGAKGGSIATRGPGETKLELDRRRLRTRVTELERQADTVRKQRNQQRKDRMENDMPVIALVGYTNAGKSTFLNALTQAGSLAENKLFATLDPVTRRLIRPDMPPCLLVDTVGFIQKLPTTLVKAFRSTLEEIQSATLIWHLMDLSHPDRENHFRAVQETLAELDCADKSQWILLNKIDKVSQPETEIQALAPLLSDFPCFPISAQTGDGVPALLTALQEYLLALPAEPERQRVPE